MLEVQSLSVRFSNETAVDDISFSMEAGECLGLVGESGSGKTMTALSIAGLFRRSAQTTGKIMFEDQDLLTLSPSEMRRIQGAKISMVFQEPMTSLNPLRRIGWQVEEAMSIHTKAARPERRAAALEAMRAVELSDPERIYSRYPHELSGGMRQRVMMAAAILMRQKLLICDEPTTALDVTTGAQIIALLQKLNREFNVGVLFISHDLGAVYRLCKRALVMQNGKIVESGSVEEITSDPKTEYTKKLIASLPGRRVYCG